MKYYDGKIMFHLENSLPEFTPRTEKATTGIGIENIKRRLALLYPDRHGLKISEFEKKFIVELIINHDSYDD